MNKQKEFKGTQGEEKSQRRTYCSFRNKKNECTNTEDTRYCPFCGKMFMEQDKTMSIGNGKKIDVCEKCERD